MEKNNLFSNSAEYNKMLNKGLSVSGEDKYYFARGRLADLKSVLPENFKTDSIFDYGCGIGDGTAIIPEFFNVSKIVGTDISDESIEFAKQYNIKNNNITFVKLSNFSSQDQFDLCYVNGVFHHIPLAERDKSVKKILNALKPGGVLALFENNPYNPFTKILMKRIPFDSDAVMLSPGETKKMLVKNGFKIIARTRFLFYFPKFLKVLRPLEIKLVHFPLGAQYCVLGQKAKL